MMTVTPKHRKGSPTSAEDAVACIQSGQRIFIHSANAFPQRLVDALVARGSELRNVEIVHLHTNGVAAYTKPEFAGRFRHRALFVGQNVREAVDEGRASYVPVFLSDVPEMFRSGVIPLNVVLLHVSPPDAHGFCSLGVSVDCSLAAARSSPVKIAQVNPRMPRTHGEAFIHVSELDFQVPIDDLIPELQVRPSGTVERMIAGHIAELIPNDATLQMGIGGIPDAVLSALGNHRNLGIHSEVISDGVVELVEKGVVTGSAKGVNRGKIVTSFLNGTRRLHAFVDDNPMVEMRPVDYTNDTRVIRRLDRMVAINSAIEIDLTGQVCAESIGSRIYSGVGGQVDFMRGAALSREGKPIIALASTAKAGKVSRIVPTLSRGAGVTTTRAHVHYVVTEYGVANLHGLDLAERARELIRLAHPDFRDELAESAYDLCLLHR